MEQPDLAHRLRTPLAVIVGYIEILALRDRDGENAEILEHLAAASADHARYLVLATLSEATPEPGIADGYARTRRFYERNGFEPVWDPTGWWDDANQAVVMVRRLG